MEKEIIRLKQMPRILEGQFKIEKFKDTIDYKEIEFNLNSNINFGTVEGEENLMGCVLKETLTDSNNLIMISLTLEGIFEVINSNKDEKELRKIFVDSLFPYIRQYINQVSLQAGIKPILLPIIDIEVE